MFVSSSSKARLRATVEGRVQGVGFRYFVLNKAQELNIYGWVRNTFNGDVELLAEADKEKLDELLAAVRHGPRSSFVTRVQESWEPYQGEFTKFDVKSTI